MSGTLRLLAATAVILLAGLAVLFVLDVIPREQMQTLAVKGGLMVLIVAAGSVAVALIMKGGAAGPDGKDKT